MSNPGSVRVILRVRPISTQEMQTDRGNTCIRVTDESNVCTNEKDPKRFAFDYVASEQVNQSQIFDAAALPICNDTLLGYNGTVFAYGQTGAGKTYTIHGNEHYHDEYRTDRGILARAVQHIYAKSEELQANGNENITISLQYLEIFHEKIYDLLLDQQQTANLLIKEDPKKGIYVAGLTEIPAGTREVMYDSLKFGTGQRHIGATYSNARSSRSHSVCTISIVRTQISETQARKTSMSKFHIIDLAGSERQKLTGARGDRLKEAGNINRSLSAIGNVINALTSKNPNVHIPYRDTKLTYLLKDSLGGNCKTHMIANVSASACCFAETLSTLSFAERAKMIQNKISRQEKMDGNFDQLKLELDKQIAINQRLQEEVSQYQSGNPHVQMAMRQPSMQQGFMAPRDDAYPFRDEPTWVQAELRQSMYLAPDGSPMGTASPMVHAPLLADNARLQNELYETKQDNQNKEGEIQQLNRELEEMRFEADEQLSQNTAKEAELQSIRVEINRLHSVIAQGEPGISQQFVETHTQLLQLQDALTQMQPELDSVNSEADELRNQVATYEHAINKKDMEISDLTSQKETFDFQLGESKCQIADLVEQCNTFIDMDEELMRERKASENLQRTNEELSAQIRSLMEKNQAKDFELNELRNRPSEDRDKVSLQQQVDQLKATIARESQKYQNLEMQLNLTKNDNQTLRNQVTEKKNEIERLNNAAGPDINFMWCQRDLKYAQERVKELEQNIQREQMEKSQLNERLIKEKRQQDQKIFSISKELDEKQKLIEDKNNHIDVIQAKITKLQEKHERSRDQKDDLRRQVYKLQEKFDILEDEVTIKDNTINELVAPNNGNARIQVFNRVRAENTQLKEEVEAAKKQGEEDVKQALNEIIKVIGKKNFIPENAALNPLHFITAFVSRAEVGLQFSSQSPTPQENMHPNERNSPYIQTPAQQLYLDSQGFPSSNISGTRPPLNDRPGTSVYKFPPNPFG